MSELDLTIGGHHYRISCQDGEELQVRALASQIDEKIADIKHNIGPLSEARQLLFACLNFADQLADSERKLADHAENRSAVNDAVKASDALDRMASRIEALADKLENLA